MTLLIKPPITYTLITIYLQFRKNLADNYNHINNSNNIMYFKYHNIQKNIV